jgi:hypothetical protein
VVVDPTVVDSYLLLLEYLPLKQNLHLHKSVAEEGLILQVFLRVVSALKNAEHRRLDKPEAQLLVVVVVVVDGAVVVVVEEEGANSVLEQCLIQQWEEEEDEEDS